MSECSKKGEFNNGLEDILVSCSPPKFKYVRMDENTENERSRNGEVPLLNHEWRGIPLEKLKIFNLKELYPPVRPSETHFVLFKLPVIANQAAEPYPRKPIDVWNEDFVLLPCSSHCVVHVSENEVKSRWDLVREAFTEPVKSSRELQEAILYYNSEHAERWKFRMLHEFFLKTLEEEETRYFFSNLLPKIIKLALSLPDIITGSIPLLKRKLTRSVSLTQKQISCLLANAFLCTFPSKSSDVRNFPDINFNRLYCFEDRARGPARGTCVQEKLKCLINYFRRVCSTCPGGVVTYSRHYVSTNKLPIWSESSSLIPELHVTSVGSIEDEGTGMMELDFANKLVGGGVLGRGCVQEEIRFVICPELIIARLFTECLDDTEALIVTGVERYNQYKGYANNFTWAGDFIDQTPRDCYNRCLCVLVALDALKFQQAERQYSPDNINRELNKAYAGFSWGSHVDNERSRLSVATGNWGCGAFRGNPHLKALIQLMAAGQTGRKIAYFTFGDPDLRDKIGNMHKFLVENKISVGQLWKLLNRYYSDTSSRKAKLDLYNYIYRVVSDRQGCVSANFRATTSISNSAAQLLLMPSSSNSDDSKPISLSSEEIESTLFSSDDCSPSYLFVNLLDNSNNKLIESTSSPEPVAAKSYSVQSKEGLDKCLQKQKDSWARIEESKKDFNEFTIVDDDSLLFDTGDTEKQISLENSKSKLSPVVKRKISDYFSTTPKV